MPGESGNSRHFLTRNVFVAGSSPKVTYNPRDERRLEEQVENYLQQVGKALSVSGPTKCGKTVLVERILPKDEAIWIQGADLGGMEAIWHKVVDWFGLYDMLEVTTQRTGSSGAEVGGRLGVPGVAELQGRLSSSDSDAQSYGYGRQRQMVDVAREALDTVPVPIVVDDFHYVPDEGRRDIARAIKSILPMTQVILIAVPHEAFEAVREEPDMEGRVWQMRVEPWSIEELCHISRKGFEALNVFADDSISERLAQSSYGAPFLMQQLCYDLMAWQNIHETQPTPTRVREPDDWNAFFGHIANRQRPAVFDKLLKGPNPRGQERAERVFEDGRSTDIYGAVMHAIAETGPRTRVRYQDLVTILERDLEKEDVPRGQHVTNSLSQMAKIAHRARGAGDAVLDYKDDELHILDPFLLFFLRHGSWDVERHALS